MSPNRRRGASSREQGEAEWPEKMKLSVARKFLGVSFSTVSNLVGSGKLAVEYDLLDRRVRLVRRSDLEELLRHRAQRR
jgi:hypothetical protein